MNIRTGELEPHSPNWFSDVQLPIAYDPAAKCPGWESFLKSALPEDVYNAKVVFLLLALLMIPYTAAQRALLLYGPRGTGKSRLLNAIRAFLGIDNTSSKSLHALEENRFASAYLEGKLANICSDLPTRELQGISTFLEITGEDFIDVEHKHGKAYQIRPFARLLFSSNKLPSSKDPTDAYLDRWWIIPLNQRFQDTNTKIAAETLDATLSDPGELSGVLNQALAQIPALIAAEGIQPTESMKSAHEEFCATVDPLRVWIADFVEADPAAFTPCDEARRSYNSFRQHHGLASVTAAGFGREFKKRMRLDDPKQRTISRDGKCPLVWGYEGMRLIERR